MSALLSLPSVFAVRLPSRVERGSIDPSASDAALVRRARRGDRWAEEALYRRHARRVTRVVLRIMGRVNETEDVVQDACVVAFESLDKLRDDDAFGDWLLSIAVRQVHRRFRRWKFMRAFGLHQGEGDVTLADQADPGAGPEARATLAEISRLLETLSTEDRVAWVLRRVEGERVDDIASLCACSRATAKRRIARADEKIRGHVGVGLPGDDDE